MLHKYISLFSTSIESFPKKDLCKENDSLLQQRVGERERKKDFQRKLLNTRQDIPFQRARTSYITLHENKRSPISAPMPSFIKPFIEHKFFPIRSGSPCLVVFLLWSIPPSCPERLLTNAAVHQTGPDRSLIVGASISF
ncbi:hypothetical protein NPIL_491411 [Nephila pilipes]|uniref:Uncharacterized protein n=1 Tax=Nephila pilipes TaxID=299642 RepID=A0A8X6MU42_NEPPI|nr:hypothetical protein NPIL_491411 [Nephila pilipes]